MMVAKAHLLQRAESKFDICPVPTTLFDLKESSMKSVSRVLCLFVLAAACNLSAQVNPYKEGTPGVTGYKAEVMAEVMVQEDKFVRLAEAIPAEKYAWRPADDVRSFAEVF